MLKRISAFLTALLLGVSLTGCDSESDSTAETQETEVITETVLHGNMQEELTGLYTTEEVFTGKTHLSEVAGVGEYLVCYSTDTFMDSEMIVYHPERGEVTARITIPAQMAMLGAMETDNGFCIALREYTGTDETPEYRYYLENYDSDWNSTGREDVTEHFGASVYIRSLLMDGSGRYAALSGEYPSEVTFYDQNYRLLGTAVNTETVQKIFVGGDGRVYTTYYLENDFATTGLISHDTLVMERVQAEGMAYYVLDAFAGMGKYDICVYDSGGLYGVDMRTQTGEKLLDWDDSHLQPENVCGGMVFDDGRLLLMCGETGYMMYPRTEEDVAQMTTITLASVMSGSPLENIVQSFNQQSSNVRVELLTSSGSRYEEMEARIMTDIFTDESPDIVCTADLDYYMLAEAGAFEDLYSFMENDEEFHTEDYFMNFFDSLAYDEKLYHLSDGFNLGTLIGKAAQTGTQQGRTPAEYLELIEGMPSGMSLFGDFYSPSRVLDLLVMQNAEQWVDYENGTNAFDTPEFIGLLEYCGSLPEKTGAEMYYYDPEVSEKFRNDELLLMEMYLSTPYQYHYTLAGMLNGEDAALVGTPAPYGGNGAVFQPDRTFAISAHSDEKEAAWEFIRYLLSEEQQEHKTTTQLPVHRGVMERMMEEAMQADGNMQNAYLFSVLLNESPDLAAAAQEEMDELYAYIENTTASRFLDEKLTEIKVEETERFFAGEQTAEETARNLSERTEKRLAMISPNG